MTPSQKKKPSTIDVTPALRVAVQLLAACMAPKMTLGEAAKALLPLAVQLGAEVDKLAGRRRTTVMVGVGPDRIAFIQDLTRGIASLAEAWRWISDGHDAAGPITNAVLSLDCARIAPSTPRTAARPRPGSTTGLRSPRSRAPATGRITRGGEGPWTAAGRARRTFRSRGPGSSL
jgi:hypothetical protein